MEALAHFWSGEIGRQIMAARNVQRELAFTARFECSELAGLGLAASDAPKDEFIVVQGVADVAVIFETEIWLLDFKTDDFSAPELKRRIDHYRPQLAACNRGRFNRGRFCTFDKAIYALAPHSALRQTCRLSCFP